MAHKPKQHGLLSFVAVLARKNLAPLGLAAYRALEMAQEVAGGVVGSCGAVLIVAEVAVAEVVGNEAVLIA
jgi:hypothetical protein